MDPTLMFQGQQLQQLQQQLRQLEQQIKLHQQQLQEAWQPQQPKEQESSQPEAQKLEPQQQESAQTESQQQSQEQQKQLPTYFTAPEMVSTLDIGYLQDMLSSNLLAVKQYRQATKDCQLPDLKLQFKEAGQMHLQQYNSLLSFLSENGGTVK